MLIISYKQGIICVSSKCRGSYDVTSAWLVLRQLCISRRPGRLFESQRLIEIRHLLEHGPQNPGVYEHVYSPEGRRDRQTGRQTNKQTMTTQSYNIKEMTKNE